MSKNVTAGQSPRQSRPDPSSQAVRVRPRPQIRRLSTGHTGQSKEWSVSLPAPLCAAVPGVFWCMSRTNVDIDDAACAAIMKRYRLPTKREAVNLALRSLASEPFSLEEAHRMRGSGWDGDLDEMRGRGGDRR